MKNRMKNRMLLLMGMIFMGGSAYGLVPPAGSYQKSCYNIQFDYYYANFNQLTCICVLPRVNGYDGGSVSNRLNVPIGDKRTISVNTSGTLTFDN